MWVILVLLILSFLLFFVLTQEVMIKLIKKESIIVELHLQIIAISFNVGTKNKDNPKKKKKSEDSRKKREIILNSVFRLAERGEIKIDKLALPYFQTNGYFSPFFLPIGYKAFVSTLLAYIETRTKKMTLGEDALILSPDINNIQCEITVKSRLFRIIHTVFRYIVYIFKEKVGKHVRE